MSAMKSALVALVLVACAAAAPVNPQQSSTASVVVRTFESGSDGFVDTDVAIDIFDKAIPQPIRGA